MVSTLFEFLKWVISVINTLDFVGRYIYSSLKFGFDGNALENAWIGVLYVGCHSVSIRS